MSELDKVMIAGQFGAHLPADSLIGTGILPAEVKDKLVYVGNSSKTGAYMALLSGQVKREMEELAHHMDYMELGATEGYERLFADCLMFPEVHLKIEETNEIGNTRIKRENPILVMRRGNVKNMGDIKDFNCTYDNSAGIRSEVTEGLGLTFPDAYTHCDTMVTLSKMLKEKDKAVICELPFCHTLEAEAMGGIINLGNEIAGPRAGGYVCTDVEEILNLPDMDFTKGRIQETLLACKKLREEGEHVVFEVAGPFTILNVLIDARYVFKGMRKKPEVMEKVFWKLGDQILKYMELVKEYGGDLISYADSSGGVNILGPKMMEAVTVNFTYPFLKKVEQLADDQTMILLCPKTTLALIGTEKAKFVDHQLEEPIGYAQACIHMIGKAHFAGQMCIKNVGYHLNHGIFKEVKLL